MLRKLAIAALIALATMSSVNARKGENEEESIVVLIAGLGLYNKHCAPLRPDVRQVLEMMIAAAPSSNWILVKANEFNNERQRIGNGAFCAMVKELYGEFIN
jgi:hypothetical protein